MANDIVALVAERGRKYEENGECVGSHGRSIVFLPKEVKPGQQVRVRLEEIQEDSRGRMMYRGVPTAVEYTERWKDNGDGTASRVQYSVDWLFVESETAALETRPLQSREGTHWTSDHREVLWGNSLADSQVAVRKVRIIPLEEERAQNGSLQWAKTSEREEEVGTEFYSVVDFKLSTSCWWWIRRFELTWDSGASVRGSMYFLDNVHWENIATTYGEMPEWWRKEQEARFPPCACGRKRYDTQAEDGFLQCEDCRKEQACERCTEQVGQKSYIVGSRLVCEKCKPWEAQEQLVERLLPSQKREAIAKMAERLARGQAFPREEGLTLLKAMHEHLPWEWEWDLFRYYYVADGFFGSSFAPEYLRVLAQLPQAAGNGLVELVNWLADSRYFKATQLEGRTETPRLNKDLLSRFVEKVEAGNAVAEFLRGSEEDRQAAFKGYESLANVLGSESQEAKVVAEAMQKYQYASAIKKAQECGGAMLAAQSGETLANFSYYKRRMGRSGNADAWVVRPDGSLRRPDAFDQRKSYPEGNLLWHRVGAEELALTWRQPRHFEVRKLPVGGLTEAQRQTVRSLEAELGEPEGSFGLDPQRAAIAEAVVQAIRKAIRCPACHQELPEIRYGDLVSNNGAPICGKDRQIARVVDLHKPFDFHCANREAQGIYSRKLSDGRIVEILAYEKGGGWNLNIRVRE